MNFANSEAVQPCKAIDGMIPLSESFRPVDLVIVHIQLLMQRAISGIRLLQMDIRGNAIPSFGQVIQQMTIIIWVNYLQVLKRLQHGERCVPL